LDHPVVWLGRAGFRPGPFARTLAIWLRLDPPDPRAQSLPMPGEIHAAVQHGALPSGWTRIRPVALGVAVLGRYRPRRGLRRNSDRLDDRLAVVAGGLQGAGRRRTDAPSHGRHRVLAGRARPGCRLAVRLGSSLDPDDGRNVRAGLLVLQWSDT